MVWKKNLSKAIIESKFPLIEISAWTNLDMPKISAMKNEKHPNLTCKEFLVIKLLLQRDHAQFINELFGPHYFRSVNEAIYKPVLTPIGKIIRTRHQFEILPKKELVKTTTITSSRIDYLIGKDDENIKIEEMTQLELALGEQLGALCDLRFPNIKLNSEKEYQSRLEILKEYNRRANDRRKG